MATNVPLDKEQTAALFDVLTHYQTYHEIEQFKSSDAVSSYGPPLQDSGRSSTPILQSMVTKFALPLPGLQNVSPDFWKIRITTLIRNLSDANLSESYDKGVLGIRKTLATACSALLEYVARGSIGGFYEPKPEAKDVSYNVHSPEDVTRAWYDWMNDLVYGDAIDELFQRASETGQLADHSELTRAAHEYVVVNLASFLHYALVIAPEGPTILRLAENVHKLTPYTLMRQSLRIGNVASMLNALTKVLLAKMSLGSVTNWLGMSNGADEGMNLLQSIMSTVLGWDRRELKKRATKIEKDAQGPGAEVRQALNDWTEKSKEEQEETRRISKNQNMSIVKAIISLSPVSTDMSEAQHAKAQEYLCLQLSVRDRREIVRVLCQSNPDHLTQAVRDAVEAYEPMIRQVHQAVDLGSTLSDVEAFVTDTIKLSKPEKGKTPPRVEDFVTLLHTHQDSSHRFIHQVAKNGKDVTAWFHEYVKRCAAQFRTTADEEHKLQNKQALPSHIMATEFSTLSEQNRAVVRRELDQHRAYLAALHTASQARISEVIRNVAAQPTPLVTLRSESRSRSQIRSRPGSASASRASTRPSSRTRNGDVDTTDMPSETKGPGAFLARWQDLLDSTIITPAGQTDSPVRKGANSSVKADSAKDLATGLPSSGPVKGSAEGEIADEAAKSGGDSVGPDVRAPDVSRTIELLGPKFRELLVERSG